jgi:hypothetical protein
MAHINSNNTLAIFPRISANQNDIDCILEFNKLFGLILDPIQCVGFCDDLDLDIAGASPLPPSACPD